MTNKTKYHRYDSCNKCTGENSITVTSFDGGHISSCNTVCNDCGFEDHWDTGFFESSAGMVSKCETYSFG